MHCHYCKTVSVLNYVSFSNILQDILLTISLISLPQRFKFYFHKGILSYILSEFYYLQILQQFSFIFLTVCLIRIPSLVFDILYKEITLTKTASINQVVELVTKWKENWLVICDLVADVNDFIGWSLFLYIIYGFFIFVSFTFFVLFRFLEIGHHDFSINGIIIYAILKFLASFCLLAFEAEKLPSKVNYRMNFDAGSTIMNECSTSRFQTFRTS